MSVPRRTITFPALLCLLLATRTSLATAQKTGAVDTPATNDNTYGVDCSFPMHTLNFRDDSRCGDLLGDRYSIYTEFMKGCREQFGARCDQTEDSRAEQMLRQVPSLKNYTSTGFAKIRAPSEMFDLVQQHWDRNNNNENNNDPKLVEEWTKGHTYVNYWAHNTTYYGLADESSKVVGGSLDLQSKLLDMAKPIIEEWTGMELRPTSLYGIRVYQQGSILNPHVDRNPLIASAIINVAQDPDMTQDWPLEVIDRDGKAVNISMVPGDMVLYESGTLIHGRPFPLQGKYYANVFVHFEPTGRRLEDIDNDDMVYGSLQNPAGFVEVEESGLQSRVRLPPYIVPGSPEAMNFADYNPWGWEVDEEDSDDEEEDDYSDSEDYSNSEDYSEDYSEDEEEEYYDSEDENDEEIDENNEYDPQEIVQEEDATTKQPGSSPICLGHLGDPARAPAECLKKMPLHKKVLSQLNQMRKNLFSHATS